MTLQPWGAVLLVGLGLLLGLLLEAAVRNLLDRALQSKLRQAEERRRLDEAWPMARAVFRQRGQCPHCPGPLSERDSCSAPKIVEEQQEHN
ncbi:MAG: hypothetical protein JO268_05140 [Pseudonocardiales bacterium]|nr:hypothetical protein [Pseudonocardiales bacterium]